MEQIENNGKKGNTKLANILSVFGVYCLSTGLVTQ